MSWAMTSHHSRHCRSRSVGGANSLGHRERRRRAHRLGRGNPYSSASVMAATTLINHHQCESNAPSATVKTKSAPCTATKSTQTRRRCRSKKAKAAIALMPAPPKTAIAKRELSRSVGSFDPTPTIKSRNDQTIEPATSQMRIWATRTTPIPNRSHRRPVKVGKGSGRASLVTLATAQQPRILVLAQVLDCFVRQLPCIALDAGNQLRPDLLEGLQCIVIVEADSGRKQWCDVLGQAA